MVQFKSLFAHRAARRLPLPERYRTAVDWGEAQIRKEWPGPDDVIPKVKSGESLTAADKHLIIAALSKKLARKEGRPPTPPGRDFLLRQLVFSVAREFNLTPTRGNVSVEFSAADAVAEAMRRAKVFPNSFDRVRKLVSKAKPEEHKAAAALYEHLKHLLEPDVGQKLN
jgi:hypothetical protein